jgi:hypothetical protein
MPNPPAPMTFASIRSTPVVQKNTRSKKPRGNALLNAPEMMSARVNCIRHRWLHHSAYNSGDTGSGVSSEGQEDKRSI